MSGHLAIGWVVAMSVVEIAIPAELTKELEESFFQGPMLTESGLRMLNEEQVARIQKMSVVIQADEHPPPHFHVRFAGENASFSIADGKRLPKVKGLEKFEYNIRAWWKENYCVLIETWNRTRPSGCAVGPMVVPQECDEAARG
jgi:hypothetical protein